MQLVPHSPTLPQSAVTTPSSCPSCSTYAYCLPRCVFPTSNAASPHTPTSSASAWSQLADSGSSIPRKATSRPSHRLQVQSTPSTAQASLPGQVNLQEAPPTSSAAGPDAAGPVAAGPDGEQPVTAGPDAAAPDTAGPYAAGPDAVGPDAVAPGADTVGGAPGGESYNVAEPDAVHTVADVQSMASDSTAKTEDASGLAATRPRLRGLRLPWLSNQAGHRPELVSYSCTPADIHHMGFPWKHVCHCLRCKHFSSGMVSNLPC